MLKYVFFEENESQDQLEKKLKNIIGKNIEVPERVPRVKKGENLQNENTKIL